MCLSLIKYPLVEDNQTKKRKVVFECGYEINSREDFDNYNLANRAVKSKALLELKFPYLSRYLIENDCSFVKFVSVPCGRCSDCLNSNARSWVFRIMSEAAQFKKNFFITLTYNDENLPPHGFLVKDEISKFNKKLKVYLNRIGKSSDFRFYGVGEYGSSIGSTLRPHYHVIYFNLDIDDLVLIGKTQSGLPNFTSPFIEKVWNKGFISIGYVEESSAAYVARYCDKKRLLSDEERKKSRSIMDPFTGEIIDFVSEFSIMSRNPGIGACASEKIKRDIENGSYTQVYKNSKYSLSPYFRKKLNIDDSKFLDYNNIKQDIYIKQRLDLSDIVSLNDYTTHLEAERIALKKRR